MKIDAMKIRQIIKIQRETMGFNLEELANKIGITKESLRDIEDYDEEIYDLDMATIRRISKILNVSLDSLFDIKDEPKEMKNKFSRNKIIKIQREAKKLSLEELAEMIGFYPEVLKKVEGEPEAIDYALPISAVLTLSTILDIPFNILLGD